MERIQLNDTPMDAILKIVEGNPGAASAIAECMKVFEKTDPDSYLGSLTVAFNLDSFGIYGSRIWILYKDLCGQDAVKMITVLRAIQIGIIPFIQVKRAIDAREDYTMDSETPLNHEELLMKVREALPNFAKEYVDGQS
jgi:hypothetical protein